MEGLGWHVPIRSSIDRVHCPDDASRRPFATTVHRLGEERGVFVFDAAGTHGHAGTVSDRATAGPFAHDLEAALACALHLPEGFAPVHLVPLRDRRHLARVSTCVLRQGEHHGLSGDPFRECSSPPDLVGPRVGATG